MKLTEQMYAIAKSVPKETEYFRANVPYPVLDWRGGGQNLFYIRNFDGVKDACLVRGCAHLDGGKWTIKPESKLTAKQRTALKEQEQGR